MASVNRFTCDAEDFPVQIIQRKAVLEVVVKDRHFAALKIQRLWRGYAVRKEVARWHRAATVLQKYVRGFLVRWHWAEALRAYQEWFMRRYYHQMATRIQAVWRGYLVRRGQISIKERLRRRLAMEKANRKIRETMREAFRKAEEQKLRQMEEEAKQWVLYILFKLHHLLRTRNVAGIYSLQGKKELSSIEKLLKMVPLKGYMDELMKVYYREVQRKKSPRPYRFTSKKMQRMEDIYNARDRSRETKKKIGVDADIHDKPFILYKKGATPEPYERMLQYTEKYTGKQFDFSRAVIPFGHVSDDFDPKPPPYYLDFWEQICEIHNLPD